MQTYAILDGRSITGHYRRPGTDVTYCGKPVGIPNSRFSDLKGWKMCARCVNSEARDRAEATVTASAALDPETVGTLPATTCATHGEACDGNPKRRHQFRPADVPATTPRRRRTDPTTRVRRDLATAVTDVLAEVDALATRPQPSAADRAAAARESRQMAELITEAEATDGTWRGQWIGDTTALFDRPTEQGSLFA
ncbi:hypothetical protein ACIBVM_18485 [[Kitasatospora] papulosa]|uniref:hypothetical protein n=1 Tax=[Kitasatospora] papulosa TaxID=1464011 RepID=UPI0037880614